jgi:hypothetical protein
MKAIDTYNKIIPHALQKQLELQAFCNSPEVISFYGKAQEAANRMNSFCNSPEMISFYGKAQEAANRMNSFYGKAQEAANRMNSFYGKAQKIISQVGLLAYNLQPQIRTINESLNKFNKQWQDISKTNQSYITSQVYDCIKDLKSYSPAIRNIDNSLSEPLMVNELADNFEDLDFYINEQGVYIPTTITDKIISTVSDFPHIVKNAATNVQKKVAISLKEDIKCYTSAIIVLKILLEYYNIDIGKETNMILDFLLLSQNR